MGIHTALQEPAAERTLASKHPVLQNFGGWELWWVTTLAGENFGGWKPWWVMTLVAAQDLQVSTHQSYHVQGICLGLGTLFGQVSLCPKKDLAGRIESCMGDAI